MRLKRAALNRRNRRRRIKNILLFGFIVPCLAIITCYLIAVTIIFPNSK